MRHLIFSLGLKAIRLARLDSILKKHTQGLGAILMLHHVRPFTPQDFAPNRLLEITPDFLDDALTLVRARGFEIISMDEVPDRIKNPKPNRPFVAITLDDGYKDLVEHALPIFKKHQSPFTAYITTGFADGTAPLWWLNLEQAIQKLDLINLEIDGKKFEYHTNDAVKKTDAFNAIYWQLRNEPESYLRKVIANLAEQAGINPLLSTKQLCLDWDGVRALSKEPLATIGAHTLTHPMLAKHDIALAQAEIESSKAIIERELAQVLPSPLAGEGAPIGVGEGFNNAPLIKPVSINHFAYPVGDETSATGRDFALAKAAGFATGVTTRKGMVFADHAEHLNALPRLSMNGLFQNTPDLDVLLSGVPFAFLNRGKKLNVD
jgi:peptidoglycan/xylan/chitin deacetylase (PgdA/CDA1 family)